eukprot:3215932-Amphidinium_carterae.1
MRRMRLRRLLHLRKRRGRRRKSRLKRCHMAKRLPPPRLHVNQLATDTPIVTSSAVRKLWEIGLLAFPALCSDLRKF